MTRWLRRGASLTLAGMLVGGALAAADEDSSNGPPATPPAGNADGRRTLGRLPANLGRGFIGVFDHDNVGFFVVGGATTAVSAIYDDNARNAITSQQNAGGTASTAGGPLYSSLLVGGLFVGGRFSHGRFRAMTYDMLDASIVNLGYTELLKVTVRRERPDGSNNQSFPSGHTSNAFALAAVAERHYGWKIGVPAYLLAGVVGVSRLQQDKHWMSDVFAGATLGYIVGRTTVRVNGKPLRPDTHTVTWSVSPRLARHSRGLALAVAF
jgi:hypothetical protein